MRKLAGPGHDVHDGRAVVPTIHKAAEHSLSSPPASDGRSLRPMPRPVRYGCCVVVTHRHATTCDSSQQFWGARWVARLANPSASARLCSDADRSCTESYVLPAQESVSVTLSKRYRQTNGRTQPHVTARRSKKGQQIRFNHHRNLASTTNLCHFDWVSSSFSRYYSLPHQSLRLFIGNVNTM